MIGRREEIKKMGRPPKEPAKRRSVMMTLRLTREERVRLRREAKTRGMTVADLLLIPWRNKKEG